MNALQKFSLEGKTVLLTGGNQGLGRAMAQALGEAGAAVALTSRTLAAAEAAAEQLRERGIRCVGIQLEVTDVDDVERVVAEVSDTFGEIDILVNNAGIGVGGAALETPDSTWHEVLATNVDGVWYCSRAVAKRMVKRGSGSIVNIGSMSGEIVNRPRWQISYLTSKAAVHQMTKGLAAEWAPFGIRVNAIAPGYFLTEMAPVDRPEYKQWCVDPAPMRRWGEPEELGPVAIFLASDASSFMTGSIVLVDGGFTLF
ncbi:MAG: glucose 1-dehydrogenase [Microbacteriaceae bacterium]